jgi:hypothetical protein
MFYKKMFHVKHKYSTGSVTWLFVNRDIILFTASIKYYKHWHKAASTRGPDPFTIKQIDDQTITPFVNYNTKNVSKAKKIRTICVG